MYQTIKVYSTCLASTNETQLNTAKQAYPDLNKRMAI